MRRAAYVAGLSFLALSSGAAQVTRWNDRAPNEWTAEAPRVQLVLETQTGNGSRIYGYGEPVRVRFRVEEDAYVVVGRVDADGRLTILFPTSPRGRTFVRGGTDTMVRGLRAGSQASFYAFDRFGTSYVFALASSTPLDLSGFRSNDFERIGLDSRFTYVNRRYAYDPDDYVQRFASWILYDAASEYDYDVVYYAVGNGAFGSSAFASSLGLCFTGNRLFYDHNDAYGYGTGGWGYSLASSCRNYYNRSLWCLGFSVYNGLAGCGYGYQPYIVRGPIPYPGTPDNFTRANKKGSGFGDDWKPETVVTKEDDWRTRDKTKEEALGSTDARRGNGEWDEIRSIPARSREELKRADRDDSRVKSESGAIRTGRFGEDLNGAVRPTRETMVRDASAREAKAAARDRNDAPQRFGGSRAARGDDAPAREPVRSAPARDRSAGSEPRPVSREPSVRSEKPASSAGSSRGESIRSEPSKGSSSGSGSSSEKRKPPKE